MSEQIIGAIPPHQPPTARTERPWGHFLQWAHNIPVTVSLMIVEPGMRLSLQSHPGRAELWIVIDEGAIVQVGERSWTAKIGEEIWIPAGGKHRLTSDGRRTRVLEIAFGNWQQNDITRYEDDFDRPSDGE